MTTEKETYTADEVEGAVVAVAVGTAVTMVGLIVEELTPDISAEDFAGMAYNPNPQVFAAYIRKQLAAVREFADTVEDALDGAILAAGL